MEQLKLDELDNLQPIENISTDELLKELSKSTPTPADRESADEFQQNAFELLMKEEAQKNEIPTQDQPNTFNPLNSVDPDKTRLKGSELINEELAVDLIDSVMISLSVVVADKVFNKKIQKSSMSLTAKEKSTISPILKKCLDKLDINFDNPFIALAVTFGAIYGAKAFQVISTAEDKSEAVKSVIKDESGKPLSKYMMKKKGLI